MPGGGRGSERRARLTCTRAPVPALLIRTKPPHRVCRIWRRTAPRAAADIPTCSRKKLRLNLGERVSGRPYSLRAVKEDVPGPVPPLAQPALLILPRPPPASSTRQREHALALDSTTSTRAPHFRSARGVHPPKSGAPASAHHGGTSRIRLRGKRWSVERRCVGGAHGSSGEAQSKARSRIVIERSEWACWVPWQAAVTARPRDLPSFPARIPVAARCRVSYAMTMQLRTGAASTSTAMGDWKRGSRNGGSTVGVTRTNGTRRSAMEWEAIALPYPDNSMHPSSQRLGCALIPEQTRPKEWVILARLRRRLMAPLVRSRGLKRALAELDGPQHG